MKRILYFYVFPLVVFCLSCANSINTKKVFQEASLKHERMVREPTSASEFEWHLLIGEFERILEAEPEGEMVDDTRWAIASCWMWIAQLEGESTGGARLRAIDAFNQLISNHVDSKYDLWLKKNLTEHMKVILSGRYRTRETESVYNWVSDLKSFHQLQFWCKMELDLVYDRY